eukprot:2631705-Pyramimonas_sp.AAC.1
MELWMQTKVTTGGRTAAVNDDANLEIRIDLRACVMYCACVRPTNLSYVLHACYGHVYLSA